MILHPTLEEARGLAPQGNLCPLYAEVPADLETPVSAYLKVARGQLLVPARERRGRRTPGALQLHRHGAVSDAAQR